MENPHTKEEFPWWLRYSGGLGLIWVSTSHLAGNPKAPEWLAYALGIAAICMMYEVLMALIVGGIVWAFFGAVAGLPTSAALVIGSLIISNSNKK